MPIHDWAKIPAGLFHHFHQHWTIEIAAALNRNRLPKGLMALIEQRSGVRESDVLAVEARPRARIGSTDSGIATMEPPTARIVQRSAKEIYAGKANRIAIKHQLGRTVAIIEIVSPGNKDSRLALRSFVEKTIEFLREGVHVLVVDLLPPTRRDPLGIHKAIWDEIEEQDFEFPPSKDRILVSYEAGRAKTAYVEPIGVGDALPDMPLFIAADVHVKVPLEPTYQATWDACPEEYRTAIETGVMPEPDAEE